MGIDESDQKAGSIAFDLLERIVAERLRRRLTTVIDTTGLDRERRLSWIESAAAASIPVFAVVFETDLEICLSRNDDREHPRPRQVVRRQHSRMKKVVAEVEAEPYASTLRETAVRPSAARVVASAAEERLQGGPAHSFGLMISRFDWGDAPFAETLLSIATRAEAAGFRDLWLMDHFRQIHQVGRPWEDIPEVYTTLSHLAAVTTSIRLGCLVTGVTHRHPVVLAKTVATLDVLSGGRAICGIGLGWDREEHHNYGIRFPTTSERYELLEETIEMLRLMWGKGSPGYSGKHFRAESLAGYPRPIQDPVPVLIGGAGETRTLRLVARLGDAANVFGPPEMVAQKVDVLRGHCQEVGRDFDQVEVTHLVNAVTAADSVGLRSQVDQLRRPGVSFEEYVNKNNGALPEDLVGLFGAYHEAGATHSIVSLPNAHLDGGIESFATVIAQMH